MIKIALCGPSGSGKTTLAANLNELIGPGFKLINYSRPTAAARLMGYDSARYVPGDDKTQWDFQTECLFEQIRAEKLIKGSFISDRSTLDPLAYLNWKQPWRKNSPEHDLYAKMAVSFCDYDYLFFVPNFGGEVEDNGIRLVVPPEPIEDEFRAIFKKYDLAVYTIKSKTVKSRLDELLSILGI